jgi:putative membrane protein
MRMLHYAGLLWSAGITVVVAHAILKQKSITPSNTLLHGAYDAMISRLRPARPSIGIT